MNPGGMDYEKWLFSQRIRATGYVRTKAGYSLISSNWSDYPLQRLRQNLRLKLKSLLPDHPVQGIVSALVLGYRDDITPEQWDVFRQTGTNHLVAISGLHIGLVAGLVFLLTRWIWARLGHLPLRLSAPQAAAILAFSSAAIYAALAGWSLPTQRALIMVGLVMLALVLKRHVQPLHGLSVALLLVLLHDPMAVSSPGFWLSFGAVSLIFLGMHGRHNGIPWWDKWFRVQWVVGLGLIPFLLLFFQQSSLISPVANFIAVPVVSLLVVPSLLCGVMLSGLSTAASAGLFNLGASMLDYLVTALAWFGDLPFASWTSVVPNSLVLILSILGVLAFMFGTVRSARWLGMVILLPLVFQQTARPGRGEVHFTLLDVGQGLSAVVQTQNHTLVFDTGPRFSNSFDTGSAVVLPYLNRRHIKSIDMLLVSHGDNDHIGGVKSLLENIAVSQVYSSAPVLLDNGVALRCERGRAWHWDGVRFQILHPESINKLEKENNQSCVLMVKSEFGTILLPGDIEREAEYQLLEAYPEQLRADILVAPHHGSKTSSTEAFIKAVQPEFVLYPTGYRNRYRFPYHKVVKQYAVAGASQFETARHGAIIFKLDANGGKSRPQLARYAQQRYWHHKAAD